MLLEEEKIKFKALHIEYKESVIATEKDDMLIKKLTTELEENKRL